MLLVDYYLPNEISELKEKKKRKRWGGEDEEENQCQTLVPIEDFFFLPPTLTEFNLSED